MPRACSEGSARHLCACVCMHMPVLLSMRHVHPYVHPYVQARGRGTSVAALKSLLQDIVKEKESASTGLVVELEEENVIRNTLDTCEAWSCRCSALLANGLGAGEAPGGDGTGGGEEEVGKERAVGSDEQEGAHNGARRSRPLLKELEQLQGMRLSTHMHVISCRDQISA